MKDLLMCAVCCAFALVQQPPKLAFEVASIKPSEPMSMGMVRIRMNTDGGMLRFSGVSLKDCIRVAYRVRDSQVQGPDWIGGTRFDIVAKLPEGAKQDQVAEMLQSLLAERFHLEAHRDSKVHPVYALLTAKNGPKLKPAAEQPSPKPAEGRGPDGGGPRGATMITMDPAGAHLKAPSATLGRLAEMISHFCDRPVVDLTGIEGAYDFDLVFTPQSLPRMAGPGPMMPPPGGGERAEPDAPREGAPSIFEALQLYGLKLEARKAPLETVVIDRIDRQPTEN